MTKKTVYDILFVLFLTSICHILFSKYGFNPTDEGFVLSATNRVLHGQIPHVDFSSVRPLGYAYLHIPELLISKTHFFLVSRFVFWLEQVLIAFLWVRFLLKYSKREISSFNKYALVIICFVFNVHYFPASVLHTIDGLLMCMIGFNIIILEKKWDFIGFLFIGFAALCKQNYLVVFPVSLFLFGRKNSILNFILGITPIVFYVVFVSINGGWNDLTTQLSGHNELMDVGIFSYLFNPMLYAGVAGAFLYHKFKPNNILFTVLILLIAVILLISNHYHGKYIFLFFGLLFGVTTHRFRQKDSIILPITTLLLAWCVSISVGYNTPALFVGGIIFLILFDTIYSAKTESAKIAFGILFTTAITFYYARTHNIYRDLSSNKLTYKLDNIVEGATGIYTNKNTYCVLQELDSLKKIIPDLIVVPDFTACNILHSHESKILTEWPNKTEIPNDKILEKVVSKTLNDSTTTYLTPIYQTALLKDGFTEYNPRYGTDYRVINYVVNNMGAISNTKYFILFKKVRRKGVLL